VTWRAPPATRLAWPPDDDPEPYQTGAAAMRRRRVGGRALLVELDDDKAVAATYSHITELIAQGRLPQARDVVPAARTVLVDGVDPDAWWSLLLAAGPVDQPESTTTPSRLVTVPIRYDGADLDEVARQWGSGRDDVAQRHASSQFTVAFCGFAPGFAYCTAEPPLPATTRRDDPRTEVPAGAVGLAGPYCGIYPTRMPGGWQLIGTTSEVMFDSNRRRPALLSPGDRVRFESLG
jgi:allophanate hydrolase subunit 1